MRLRLPLGSRMGYVLCIPTGGSNFFYFHGSFCQKSRPRHLSSNTFQSWIQVFWTLNQGVVNIGVSKGEVPGTPPRVQILSFSCSFPQKIEK